MNIQRDDRVPKITRRLALGSGLAVAAGSVLATGMPALADEKSLSLPGGNVAYILPEDHWANLVGETFTVNGFSFEDQVGRSRDRLTLVETEEVAPGSYDKHRPKNFKRFAISLLFHGSGKIVLPQASYRVKHPWFGEFDLFFVNVKTKRYKNDIIYEAIINN